MLKAYDVTATREVTLKGDTEEPQTVFILGRLDVPLRDWITNTFFEYAGKEVKLKDPGTLFTALVRFGVKGWKDFKDAHGNDVPFDTVSVSVNGVGNRPGLSDKFLDYLQPYMVELGTHVLNEMQLNEGQEKN